MKQTNAPSGTFIKAESFVRINMVVNTDVTLLFQSRVEKGRQEWQM